MTLQDEVFVVEAGSLIISVILYAVCASICLCFLVIRRNLSMFGKAELGGPANSKYFTGVFFIFLWLIYVVISSLVSYNVINIEI